MTAIRPHGMPSSRCRSRRRRAITASWSAACDGATICTVAGQGRHRAASASARRRAAAGGTLRAGRRGADAAGDLADHARAAPDRAGTTVREQEATSRNAEVGRRAGRGHPECAPRNEPVLRGRDRRRPRRRRRGAANWRAAARGWSLGGLLRVVEHDQAQRRPAAPSVDGAGRAGWSASCDAARLRRTAQSSVESYWPGRLWSFMS